jgi:hypothetical protein
VPRILLLASRQPELAELLEDAGFEVELRNRPLDGERLDYDTAVVFRGRLIGRGQAERLSEAGVPVVEVHTGPPTSPSRAGWIRLSSRIGKPDLVQIVQALAAEGPTRSP